MSSIPREALNTNASNPGAIAGRLSKGGRLLRFLHQQPTPSLIGIIGPVRGIVYQKWLNLV